MQALCRAIDARKDVEVIEKFHARLQEEQIDPAELAELRPGFVALHENFATPDHAAFFSHAVFGKGEPVDWNPTTAPELLAQAEAKGRAEWRQRVQERRAAQQQAEKELRRAAARERQREGLRSVTGSVSV